MTSKIKRVKDLTVDIERYQLAIAVDPIVVESGRCKSGGPL